jgi:hypothetical protein
VRCDKEKRSAGIKEMRGAAALVTYWIKPRKMMCTVSQKESWGQCYDFENIFAGKIGIFDTKHYI